MGRLVGWLVENALLLVLVTVSIGFVLWLSGHKITAKDAGAWGHSHWLPILVTWGIVTILIVHNKWWEGLHWLSGAAVFVLIVAAPFIGWFGSDSPSPSKPPVAAMPKIPLTTAPQAEWSKLTIPPGGKSERIPLPNGMYKIYVAGDKYKLYSVFADGSECGAFGVSTCPDGAVIEYYVVNEATKTDVISYAFVSR